MTLKSLTRELCRREGKKKQVDIAQMSETLRNLFDIAYEQQFDFFDITDKQIMKRGRAATRRAAKK